MTCERFSLGGKSVRLGPDAIGGSDFAIVCVRGARPRAVCRCGTSVYTRLCDHREPGRKRTCDAKLCDRCAVSVGPNRDLCPAHARAAAAQPSLPFPACVDEARRG